MNIPSTIDECMSSLNEVISKQDQFDIFNMAKDDLITLHPTLGRWIRNNWGLWTKGPLKDYMMSLGFTHPDNMSQSIIVEYWNRLNSQPSQLEEDAKRYWKENGL